MSQHSMETGRPGPNYFHAFLSLLFVIRETILFPALAAYLVACLLGATGLMERMTPVGWFVAAPAIYCLWVLVYLGVCALHIQALFWRYNKPRHALVGDGVPGSASHVRLPICYARAHLVKSLPLVAVAFSIPALRALYLLSYSPRSKIGKNVYLTGFLYDPDLIEIGDEVVLGGGCVIAAHAFASLRPGTQIYISAPVRICDRATIGADSHIGLGVTVGAGAIVERASFVIARTEIGPGEVWGGNPAVLLRRRTSADRR